ncbi:N-acetylglucosamine-6-phosphate deacetylase [Limimaricola pyoseonensis]|uniref:N-acetylglucosamine-6-phosphate deacetylase n=1 Tax=Limimaricola pyoseonensis TaxID=521013 RepID=A0A1G7HQT1_9RHOB|nr:N-acetylglucosamine-6-phosphate deacetylase [Limimaricola pyoseonensis]SDF02644.1 N-acetylglucosamine-6-phosphate deacetylase [Limimaricola pyoseonensis]
MPDAARFVLLPGQLYDGDGALPRPGRAVIVEEGRILAVTSAEAAPAGLPRLRVPIAAPGFIDLQINGGDGVMFNDAPEPETLARIARAARRGGTAHLLPTFVTAPGRAYAAAMDAVRAALRARLPGILGLHLEGPFLSPRRPGIHPPAAIRPIAPEDVAVLERGIGGPLLLTLAPEEVPPGTIARLAAAGLRVFAGHSEATLEEVASAADEGLRGGTHLYNAMSQLTGRGPGLVGALLGDDRLFAGLIADGIHVHGQSLALALRCKGARRLCLVTDAMATLAAPDAAFTINGKRIAQRGGRLADAEGRLAGAHLAMDEAVRNMIGMGGATRAEALRMASTTPAAALGLGHELGRVAPGYRASLTLLDDDLEVLGVVVDGATFLKDID